MFKLLQWVPVNDEWGTELAETAFGLTYEVYNRGDNYYVASRDGWGEFSCCDTLEEVKQACESDYHSRLRKMIEPLAWTEKSATLVNDHFVAITPFRTEYIVILFHWETTKYRAFYAIGMGIDHVGVFGTQEEAKQACETDYYKRMGL